MTGAPQKWKELIIKIQNEGVTGGSLAIFIKFECINKCGDEKYRIEYKCQMHWQREEQKLEGKGHHVEHRIMVISSFLLTGSQRKSFKSTHQKRDL